MADIPATEQLVFGLGRVWQHRSMVQVMGAMPFDDLLLQLRGKKRTYNLWLLEVVLSFGLGERLVELQES